MSTLAVNSITDANGGSNTVVNGVVSSPGGMMFRNRIINGDMKIYQRAQTYSGATGTGYYTADRARTSMSGAGTATVDYEVLLNQNVDGTIMNALKSVVTTTDPGRQVRYNQRIEPFNMIDMSGKEVTLSFYAKADTSLTLNNIALGDNGTGSLTPVSFSSVNLTTSWQRFTFTGTLDDLTTSSYLDVIIGLSGDTGNLTAATWYITGVQLEVGSVATPFERRPYGMELALCQRYCPVVMTNGSSWIGSATSTTSTYSKVYFPVETRVPATGITVSSAGHFAVYSFNNTALGSCTNVAFASSDTFGAWLQHSTTAGSPTLAAGNVIQFYGNNASARLLFTGCEL